MLEGRDKCDIKLTSPVKFKTGRSDCIPFNETKPYATEKEENHPLLSGTSGQILDFLKQDFNMSARDTTALMGIHGVIKHKSARNLRILGFKYQWMGTPYLSTIYYKMLANKPLFAQDNKPHSDSDDDFRGGTFKGLGGDRVAQGDAQGRPVKAFR